ncbi:class I SAM-dependent methyltransferase [Capnocytophaga leadbetteri]|uniref:class I SAM-dependent methyltransferase n=1 Tax=Capnocytophaga leadbetteri TaxID=327575 RepID=UPI0026E9A452|nr:class I SAM-dependent methyltransferase [Capnocytophaga leadbetteri]
MTTRDYSVSQETFKLCYDPQLQLYRTTPVPSQLGRYYESENYISHTDGRKTLFEKLYQWVKRYNLKHKIKLINQYKKENINLLDIGAGTGDFIKACEQYAHWQAVGVEPSDKARTKALSKGLTLYPNYDALTPHSFDVITLWHVLEHIPDTVQEIKILKNLLKDNGLLVIAVPNYRSWDAKHYQQYWAAFDVPRHLWHFSKESIKQLFAAEGFELIATYPMLFDAFYVSMLSEQYKTGKKSFLKGIYSGLRSNYYGYRKGEYSSHIYLLRLVN